VAATESVLVVLDAGPLIHLDELNCHQVLGGFEKLLIPSVVWQEATRHRPFLTLLQIPRAQIADPHGLPPLNLQAASPVAELHVGEIAALTLLHEAGGGLLLSDDDAARRTAEALGFSVSGTLGLLLRGIRLNLITNDEVRAVLRDLRARTTLHVSRAVLARFAAAIPD
jgi:predicted nucleic acid-binding protein